MRRSIVGGNTMKSARSSVASLLTAASKRASTSSNTALRPKMPCTPTGMISPALTMPSWNLCASYSVVEISVVLEHEEHRRALAGDTLVADHQRARQHVAIVTADRELAVVLVGHDA